MAVTSFEHSIGQRGVLVTLETNSSGNASETTPPLVGVVDSIVYEKDDFDTGVGFTIKVEETGENLWNQVDVDASTVQRPRLLAQDTTGSDLTSEYVPVVLSGQRITVTVANGGSYNSGSFGIILRKS